MSRDPPDPRDSRGDALGDVLRDLRLSGAFYARSELTAPWGIDLPAFDDTLMLHVLTAGRCWLACNDDAPLELRAGDLAVLPHGEGHRLTSAPDAEATPLFDLPRQHTSPLYEILRHGGGGERTAMICAVIRFASPAARRLIASLPPVLHIASWEPVEASWLQTTLRLMSEEAVHARPGCETILARLCDVLVVQAIRTWLATSPDARSGWLGALRDPHLGRAVAALHGDPGHPWTVASLAREAAMSRSAFAARFTEMVGETPLSYVTSWRMHVAQDWMHDATLTLADIGWRLGYQSEAAFNRAFKRVVGVTPGAARRALRTTPSA